MRGSLAEAGSYQPSEVGQTREELLLASLASTSLFKRLFGDLIWKKGVSDFTLKECISDNARANRLSSAPSWSRVLADVVVVWTRLRLVYTRHTLNCMASEASSGNAASSPFKDFSWFMLTSSFELFLPDRTVIIYFQRWSIGFWSISLGWGGKITILILFINLLVETS